MKKLLLVAISALILVACKQERPVGFEQTDNTFTIWNKDIKLLFQLDSIPGAVMVNDKTFKGSIGLGGTAPLGLSGYYLPQNKGSVEIVDWNPERIILHESFPTWEILDNKLWLDRQLTLYADSNVFEVFDYYYGEFDKLHIAAELPSGYKSNGDTVSAVYDGMAVSLFMNDCANVRSIGNRITIDREVFRNEPVHYKVIFRK